MSKWNEDKLRMIDSMDIGDSLVMEAENDEELLNVITIECINLADKKHIAVSYDFGDADLFNVHDLYTSDEILSLIALYYEETERNFIDINNANIY